MTEETVVRLAREVVSEKLPDLEHRNQSYYYGIVNIIAGTIINDYALDIIGSEESVKELMIMDLQELSDRLRL